MVSDHWSPVALLKRCELMKSMRVYRKEFNVTKPIKLTTKEKREERKKETNEENVAVLSDKFKSNRNLNES